MKYNKITLRELVGSVLVEEGTENRDIFVIDSDLAKSTTTNKFQDAFPERFFESGQSRLERLSEFELLLQNTGRIFPNCGKF